MPAASRSRTRTAPVLGAWLDAAVIAARSACWSSRVWPDERCSTACFGTPRGVDQRPHDDGALLLQPARGRAGTRPRAHAPSRCRSARPGAVRPAPVRATPGGAVGAGGAGGIGGAGGAGGVGGASGGRAGGGSGGGGGAVKAGTGDGSGGGFGRDDGRWWRGWQLRLHLRHRCRRQRRRRGLGRRGDQVDHHRRHLGRRLPHGGHLQQRPDPPAGARPAWCRAAPAWHRGRAPQGKQRNARSCPSG